jgi:sugar phosphate isomerase/epimerase
MKRREFIRNSAFTAVSVLAIPTVLQAAKKKTAIGLQLYTLRDTINKDPRGHLEKIAAMGYKNLEAYSYKDGNIFGMTYAEFGKIVKDLGMQVTSGHYGLDIVDSPQWEKALTDAKAIGQKYVVLPWLEEKYRGSVDSYKKICQVANKAGEVAKKYGLRLQYHNHAFEFNTVEGQLPYDVMLKEFDPKYVGMEMDIFWVYNAGKDPLQYFEKYPGRFEQWHVKDMSKDDKAKNADVGTGTIDWKKIFANAKKSGMKNFYVEQETYPGAPIDSVVASINYLKTIL